MGLVEDPSRNLQQQGQQRRSISCAASPKHLHLIQSTLAPRYKLEDHAHHRLRTTSLFGASLKSASMPNTPSYTRGVRTSYNDIRIDAEHPSYTRGVRTSYNDIGIDAEHPSYARGLLRTRRQAVKLGSDKPIILYSII